MIIETAPARTVAAARPSLPARLHPLVRDLINRAGLVEELVSGLGSPLHLLLPQVFDATVQAFQAALAASQVDGLVLFAKKANKALCFAQRCAALGIGVDVASAAELQQALGAGVLGESLGVSGPAKSAELLDLALRQGCWIAIDSPQELVHAAQRAARVGRVGRVLLRCRPDGVGQDRSRFGLTPAERLDALHLCGQFRESLTLEGFSFHLSGYSAAQRAAMADQMIDLCLEAREAGMDCRTINIGGGFAVGYVEPANWAQFQQARGASDFHADKSFEDFYPYGSTCAGADMLAEILAAPTRTGPSLGARLRTQGIRLLLEPGRALLDQAGVTAFRILGVKDRHATQDYALLTAEGMSFSLSEQWFNSEYLPDPLLLGAAGEAPGRRFHACVGGASCLDSDMLTWRKVPFPGRVRVGDILVYPNTAGYQMDSNESTFHDLPLPRKVVVTQGPDRVHWRLDETPGADPLAELS